jgi:hypothetical protein
MSLLAFTTVVFAGVSAALWHKRRTERRDAFIRDYVLPQGLFENLRKRRPGLQLKDCQLVAHALRHFFLAHLRSNRQYVSMPSQVADELWHEFILFTRHYEAFCRGAFGRFLHHTPAVAVGSAAKADAGLQRAWWYACREDHINPRAPTRLPLLFALDAKLGITDGFRYALDCRSAEVARQSADGAGRVVIYCGADLAAQASDPAHAPYAEHSSDGVGGDGGGGSGCGGDGGCGGGGCGGD